MKRVCMVLALAIGIGASAAPVAQARPMTPAERAEAARLRATIRLERLEWQRRWSKLPNWYLSDYVFGSIALDVDGCSSIWRFDDSSADIGGASSETLTRIQDDSCDDDPNNDAPLARRARLASAAKRQHPEIKRLHFKLAQITHALRRRYDAMTREQLFDVAFDAALAIDQDSCSANGIPVRYSTSTVIDSGTLVTVTTVNDDSCGR
jgi:hypothetical protein